MTRRGMAAVWAVALICAGCPEDPSTGTPDDGGIDARTIDASGMGGAGGAGGMGGIGGAAGMGGAADVGVAPDAGDAGVDAVVDQGPPVDMFMGASVESCQEACDRYAGCERLNEIFGDEQECLARCARLTRDDRVPEGWWSCLEIETCNLLHLCRVPAVEPLTCEAVCGRAEECGVPLGDCVATCAEEGAAFQACGETQVDQCDPDAFVECLGRDVFTDCQRTCAEGVRCNVIRAEGCLLECVGAVADPDPLFRLRASQRNRCVGTAMGECAAINQCINPPAPGEVPIATPEAFCRLYRGCGFDAIFPCEELLADFGRDPNFLVCGIGVMSPACPEDFIVLIDQCLEGGGGPNPLLQQCGRLCEGQDVCGLLEDAGGRAACVQACTGAQGADPDAVERAASALPCVVADRCPALAECLDASGPAAECAAHCALLDGCGQAGPDCAAECDAVWPRDRHAAHRACVAEAADCAGVEACSVPPGAPCAAACARIAACGAGQQAGCEGACDDAHFADPTPQLLINACLVAAPDCDGDEGLFNCPRQPEQALACLGFCRAATECDPDAEEDLGACLARCGQGLVGDDGLRFRVGRSCLEGLPPDAACPALDACIPDDLEVDCPAHCGRAMACGVELADCAARCAEDPLARLRVLQQAECLVSAGEDCAATRACMIPAVLPPDPAPGPVDEAAFCRRFDACGFGDFFGPCAFLLEDIGEQPGALRCLFDEIRVACPNDPFVAINQCFQGEPARNPLGDACAGLCEAQAFCGAADDQGACRRACEALWNPGDPDSVQRLAPRMACADAWSCPDLAACVEDSAPADVCAAHCGRLADCDAIANPALCVAACDRDFARLRHFAWRDCVGRAAECAAVDACSLAPSLPCGDACAALAECSAVAADCAANCDDRHFTEPQATALEVACILASEGCQGEGSIPACLEDPGAGARACLGYCRAVTECDPDADFALLDCLNGCVSGFEDQNGLRFAGSAECFDDVAPDADCRLVRACLPEAVAVDCAAHCRALDDCRIPGDDCAAACAAGAVSLDVGGCVADARRAGGACAEVAACVDHAPAPAGPSCVRACERRADCDRAVDPYLCRLDCTPQPPALAIQTACADLSACGDELDACFELGAEPSEACVEACGGAEACARFPAAADCAALCTGQDASPRTPDGWPADIAACLGEVIEGPRCDDDAAGDCFTPAICAGHDDVILVPAAGGRFNLDTVGRANAYAATCGARGAGPEAVLAVIVRAPSVITATVLDADYDTVLFARRDDCDADDAEVACNDDFNGLLSRLQFQAAAGTYYIFLDGFGGDAGRANLDIVVRAQ